MADAVSSRGIGFPRRVWRRLPRRIRVAGNVMIHRSRQAGRDLRASLQMTLSHASALEDSARWRLDSFRGRSGLFRVEDLSGTVDSTDLPVIVCLWKRPQRIDQILEQLDAQTNARPVRLLLWNNNPSNDSHYRARIAAFQQKHSLASVEYVNSTRNLGGLARFYLARRLLRHGYRGHFIMLDDDEDVTAGFTDSLLACAEPHQIAGWWAYKYVDSHWNRTAAKPGEIADYVGTGGTICDVDIVRDRTFFTDLPRRFSFLEDQWMCAYAKERGWAIRKAEVDITFVLHETNQFLHIADLKDEFRTYLAARS